MANVPAAGKIVRDMGGSRAAREQFQPDRYPLSYAIDWLIENGIESESDSGRVRAICLFHDHGDREGWTYPDRDIAKRRLADAYLAAHGIQR